MEIKKETPSRNMSKWTKQDRKTLKSLTKEKKRVPAVEAATNDFLITPSTANLTFVNITKYLSKKNKSNI
jgi:hypothetical protein